MVNIRRRDLASRARNISRSDTDGMRLLSGEPEI